MLYIFTALRAEAEPFIEELHLKKTEGISAFSQYENEDAEVCLTVTGTGPVRAAAAVGAVLGKLPRDALKNAALLNFGSCAACRGAGEKEFQRRETVKIEDNNALSNGYFDIKEKDFTGRLFRINKLINSDSGRVWYPDILIKSALPEAGILTGSRVLDDRAGSRTENLAADDCADNRQGNMIPDDRAGSRTENLAADDLANKGHESVLLYDMEAAAIYEAANLFLGPHQMHFLKVVTDMGRGGSVTPEYLKQCVSEVRKPLTDYVNILLKYLHFTAESGEEAGYIEECAARLAQGFAASASMKAKITRLIRYARCAGINWKEYINKLKIEGRYPAPDRKTGKAALSDFEKALSLGVMP